MEHCDVFFRKIITLDTKALTACRSKLHCINIHQGKVGYPFFVPNFPTF